MTVNENGVAVNWTPLPMYPEYTSYSTDQTVQYRVLVGGVAQLMGVVKKTDGSTFDESQGLVSDLPPELCWREWVDFPNYTQYQRCWVSESRSSVPMDGAVFKLEMDGMEGMMRLFLPQAGVVTAVDLTATWAVDPPNPA